MEGLMPVRHVYDKVRSLDRTRGIWITLENKVCIGLPPSADFQTKHVEVGDHVLLDLEKWSPDSGMAQMHVYRGHHAIMTCGIGADGCQIDLSNASEEI